MTGYKLSETEATALVVNLLSFKLFLLAPAQFIETAGSGALFTVVLVFLVAVVSFFVYSNRMQANEKHAFRFKYSPLVVTVFATLIMICAVVTLSQMLYCIKAMAFPKSPTEFVAIPFAVCILYCAHTGLKSVGRVHGFFVPLIYGTLLLLILFSFRAFSFTNLTPILGKGIRSVFGKGFFLLSTLFEFVIVYYMPDMIDGSLKKVGIRALLWSFLYFVLVVGAFMLVGGRANILPVFTVIQASLFSRTDSMFILLYALSGMLYLSAMLYFAIHIFSVGFAVKNRKPLTIPFALILFSFCRLYPIQTGDSLFFKLMYLLLWTFPFLLPHIFGLINKMKQKHPHQKEEPPL